MLVAFADGEKWEIVGTQRTQLSLEDAQALTVEVLPSTFAVPSTLVVYDVDAPGTTFYCHYLVVNIPPTTDLEVGVKTAWSPPGGTNSGTSDGDLLLTYYPPQRVGHHYHYQLYHQPGLITLPRHPLQREDESIEAWLAGLQLELMASLEVVTNYASNAGSDVATHNIPAFAEAIQPRLD
jgi:hypothetical protein